MPRKSIQSLTIRPVVDVARLRLTPGADLTPTEQRVFSRLVGSVDAGHFRASDRLMVAQLARAIVIGDVAAAELERQGLIVADAPNPLIRVVREQSRLIAALARACRLTTQSRISKDKAGAPDRTTFDSDALIEHLDQMGADRANS